MGLSSGCLFCNIPFSRVYHRDVCLACMKKLTDPFIAMDRIRISEEIRRLRDDPELARIDSYGIRDDLNRLLAFVNSGTDDNEVTNKESK